MFVKILPLNAVCCCYIITAMFKSSIQTLHQNVTKVSLILLITLLCAFASHAQHVDFVIDAGEAHQCQLCQHNIDTPPEFTVNFDVVESDFAGIISSPILLIITHHHHHIPQLRAPPVYTQA